MKDVFEQLQDTLSSLDLTESEARDDFDGGEEAPHGLQLRQAVRLLEQGRAEAYRNAVGDVLLNLAAAARRLWSTEVRRAVQAEPAVEGVSSRSPSFWTTFLTPASGCWTSRPRPRPGLSWPASGGSSAPRKACRKSSPGDWPPDSDHTAGIRRYIIR